MSGIPERLGHLSDDVSKDNEGFWWLSCGCGESFGPFPSLDIAVDAYGDHIWQIGQARAGGIVSDRYAPLGARGDGEGLYVHFEPGFGLNVVIGLRGKNCWGVMEEFSDKQLRISIDGFEKLGELINEWHERDIDSERGT